LNKGRLTRVDIEQREDQQLAPWAARSGLSRGHVYPVEPHPLRTAFQRDRDRIIHSAAFRRLEYKTQVFIPHEQDHYRTRLTHTIEVAQISRTIARNLRLNEDLAEAIALAHDLGHTPFGHSGEDVLNELLKSTGGFNHNRQSLRIVDVLEQRYPEHPGLNLSYEVREGIAKHESKGMIALEEFNPHEQSTLEAALVDLADEIAYNSHDIDDGLSSQLITIDDLRAADFWRPLCKLIDRDPERFGDGDERHVLVRSLINLMATGLIDETLKRIEQSGINNLDDLRAAPAKLCCFSSGMSQLVGQIKLFLQTHLYHHPKLQSMSDWAAEIIEKLHSTITADPSIMSVRFQQRLTVEPTEIVVADYIAGMTDRFAQEMYGGL